jgi:hypothetical protein
MPFYYGLKRLDEPVRRRAAAGLLKLRTQFEAEGVPKKGAETLLLATWNIREFDSEKYGPRCDECFYYIAEIVSRFDLIAIQEVREDLAALDRVQEILGGWWKYIVTDVTEGMPGNRERMAFMFDSRRIAFGGLAGEIVLPVPKGGSVVQFARTPFICGFKAGWTKFNICTVHIYYGDATPNNAQRVREIADIAKFLAARAKEPNQPARPDGAVTAVRNPEPENIILLGDFNIFNRDDATMEGILGAGFQVPPQLQQGPGSNLARDKHYDQIAYIAKPNRFGTTGKAGAFDYYKSVFADSAGDDYGLIMGPPYKAAKNPQRYYRDWRTYQMSDHLLMWIELRTDYGREYLTELRDGPAAGEVGAAHGTANGDGDIATPEQRSAHPGAAAAKSAAVAAKSRKAAAARAI